MQHLFKTKFLLIIFYILILSSYVSSQIPEGYYDSAEGLSGQELFEALHQIINNHTKISYTPDKRCRNKRCPQKVSDINI